MKQRRSWSSTTGCRTDTNSGWCYSIGQYYEWFSRCVFTLDPVTGWGISGYREESCVVFGCWTYVLFDREVRGRCLMIIPWLHEKQAALDCGDWSNGVARGSLNQICLQLTSAMTGHSTLRYSRLHRRHGKKTASTRKTRSFTWTKFIVVVYTFQHPTNLAVVKQALPDTSYHPEEVSSRTVSGFNLVYLPCYYLRVCYVYITTGLLGWNYVLVWLSRK